MQPDSVRKAFTGVLAAIAFLALVALFRGHPERLELTGGELAPIYAAPAERVEVRSIVRGRTLGETLEGLVGLEEQQGILTAFRRQASPRRIRAGTEVALRYRASDESLRRVDVTLSGDETVRMVRTPTGWISSKVLTPVWTDTIFVAGVIEDALWNAVVGNPALEGVPSNDRAELIYDLDKVFQWQVDFSRQIQRGDYYRFAYQREVRPDGTMRAGHIIAAELINAGTSFHAVWFDPNGDGEGTYYDLDGRSVRRAFLLKPLEFRHISSRFSSGRFHPILKRWRAHRGVDYAADRGTPIMATADGVIISRGRNGGLGNAVVIRHPNGFVTRYGHMSSFRSGHSVGTRVRQSEVIGYVGATGLATGPHLHYEMHRSGQPIDPLAVELPSGDPVPADDRARWTSELVGRLALLESLPGPDRMRRASAASRGAVVESEASSRAGRASTGAGTGG